MTLPASGPLALGANVDVELGFPATTQINLGSPAVRTLYGVPSGAIRLGADGYGKSNRKAISFTFAAPASNQTVALPTLPGYTAGKSDITITVNSGVYVWSSSNTTSALTFTGGTTGDTVKLVNNGYIMGQGGQGGGLRAPGSTFPTCPTARLCYVVNPQPGGPAISLSYPITIDNTNPAAYIGGGGGGGGHAGPNCTIVRQLGAGGAGGGAAGDYQYWCSCTKLKKGFLGIPGGAIGQAGVPGACNVVQFSALPTRAQIIQGGGGGAGGGGAASCFYCCCPLASGGSGGRIFPGAGGAGAPCAGSNPLPARGGNGGSGNNAGGRFSGSRAGGGGGGWGASGGNGGTCIPTGPQVLIVAGGSGGNAVTLNGKTVTWKCSNTTRVYGSVA